MKTWYESKTVWVAIIQGLVGVLGALMTSNPDLQTLGGIVLLKSILDISLRFATNEPLL